MKIDYRIRKNNNSAFANVKGMSADPGASVPAVAAVIVAAVLLVVSVMMGLGSGMLPN